MRVRGKKREWLIDASMSLVDGSFDVGQGFPEAMQVASGVPER
jgi:hypothetical protein